MAEQFKKYVTLVNVDTDRPVQVGGLNLVKGCAREVQNEQFFKSLLLQNPHHVVECDETGKPIGEIPEPMKIEAVPKTVRTARDEEALSESARIMREQEKERILSGLAKPEVREGVEEQAEPEAMDIEVPPLAGPPDHPEVVAEEAVAPAVEETVVAEPSAPAPEEEKPAVEAPTVTKKTRRGGK